MINKTSQDMRTIIHKSDERGRADHGWLKAKHSFSFAQWFNPEKMNFGALRVLNDDKVAPGTGFGTHPHNNMEIITIPLKGKVLHKDNMGHGEEIKTGEIQVMSAGTGITHSEYNGSSTEDLELFQIWIMPNKHGATPRYDQFSIDMSGMQNNFLQLVSPNKDDSGSWINQDAWIHMAEIEAGQEIEYAFKEKKNGAYSMLVEGKVRIGDETLNKRDAFGAWETEKVSFFAEEKSKVLVIEVPMEKESYA